MLVCPSNTYHILPQIETKNAIWLYSEVKYRWTRIWLTQWDQENCSVICKICHMHIADIVRHMQVCILLHWGPHLIGIKVKTAREYAWLDFYYTSHVFVCYTNYQMVGTECCLVDRISAHVLVSAGINRLLGTCLSGIHNANYIVNRIVCAVILVHGSQVSAYRIRPTHGPIHILDMHGTGTKHIVRHGQKSGVQ